MDLLKELLLLEWNLSNHLTLVPTDLSNISLVEFQENGKSYMYRGEYHRSAVSYFWIYNRLEF